MEYFRGGTAAELIPVRLDTGEDVVACLARLAGELNVGMAVVASGAGTLERVRLAAISTMGYPAVGGPTATDFIVEKQGAFQVIGMQGTLLGDRVDVQLSVVRRGEVVAGRAADGCVVLHTLECILLRLGGIGLARVPDPATGIPLLKATRAPAAGVRVTLQGHPVDPSAVALVPADLLRRYHAVPLARTGNALVVALPDPNNLLARDDLRAASGLQIQPIAAPLAEIRQALAQLGILS
jgi:predicted DNA-binding protein with PD1-like motif